MSSPRRLVAILVFYFACGACILTISLFRWREYQQRAEQQRFLNEIARAVEDYEKGGEEAALAHEKLKQIGTAKLLAILESEGSASAAGALGALGPEAEEAVSALIEAMEYDRDPSLQAAATQALGRIGPGAKGAVPALVSVLRSRGRHKSEAVEALGRIGPNAQESVPVLLDALTEWPEFLELKAIAIASALQRIDPGWRSSAAARAVVARLVAHLTQPDESGIARATSALRYFGPGAATAVPALIALLSGKNENHKVRAAITLGEIGPPAAASVPALVRALADPDEFLQMQAAFALGEIGARTEMVVSALVKAVVARGLAQWQAIDALGKLGPGASAAIPVLEEIRIEQQNPESRAKVTAALGKIRKR